MENKCDEKVGAIWPVSWERERVAGALSHTLPYFMGALSLFSDWKSCGPLLFRRPHATTLSRRRLADLLACTHPLSLTCTHVSSSTHGESCWACNLPSCFSTWCPSHAAPISQPTAANLKLATRQFAPRWKMCESISRGHRNKRKKSAYQNNERAVFSSPERLVLLN
jgi:hypothetical protein